ncbi:hypothetical protein K9N68_29860 [Kovacikia minuta CCNUW1]|uniref:hypothetical protein n=1 Tax=Kovacikia minuta TaxID=2931930 RepID=UPI001CCFED04|nr:hypothetical protein [Kovacikia minuta]UBF25716.1 hypothetical protein K9N68_29860 [Kovacikia minuta CCNUW1]
MPSIQKAPRRFAARTQAMVQNFQTNLEDYLLQTEKEELNPDAIKRDLKLLLRDPKEGLERLEERWAACDRDTLVAILAQRDDLTEAEVHQIVDQVEAAQRQLVEQVREIQTWTQAQFVQLAEKIRTYFKDLKPRDLAYESIQTDLQKLLTLPQEGVETVGNYLRDLNRETLTTLLSARQDLSQFVVNQIVDRAEAVRLGVLEQLERLSQEANNRLQELQQQAQQRAEATRKAAAIAAWWLLSIVFSSALVAALGGALAVKGWALFNWVATAWQAIKGWVI